MVAHPAHPLRVVVPPRDPFETVYLEHHDFVWRSLRALGVPEAAVDDVTQDVFMIVHRRLDDYDPTRAVRGWIFGIARNIAHRHFEKRTRRSRALSVVDPEPVEPPSPERIAILNEAASVVESFLGTLDEAKRSVFVLCELEGATAPEAARALGIKLNTVYSRLRVARELFSQAVARAEARRTRRAP